MKIFVKVDAQTNLCEAGHREISAPWLCGEGDCDFTLLTSLLREKMTVAVSRPPVRASLNRITRERGCAASVTAAVSPDLDVWQLLHVLHSDIWHLLRLHTDTSLFLYLSQFTEWNFFNKYKNKQSS